MSDDKRGPCEHGYVRPIDCAVCSGFPAEYETPPKVAKWHMIAKVGPYEMHQVMRGADWEFKLEGVPSVMPRCRLTLRLSEGEAEALFNYAYMPQTGTLVKYKVRKALHEYFGPFLMDLIDATGLPILILPWGDPIGTWMKEN